MKIRKTGASRLEFAALVAALLVVLLAPAGLLGQQQEANPQAGTFPQLSELPFDSQEEALSEIETENPFDDPIETDRDSFTPATTTVAAGRWIFESAYSFVDNRHVKETHSYPETLLRYGLAERFELRLGWNYEVGGGSSDVSGVDVGESELFDEGRLEQEGTLSYGAKVRLTDQGPWLPGTSVILQGQTPTSGAENDSQLVATIVWGWELPNCWQLDGSIRYATASEEEDEFNLWAPSVVLKAPVGERVNVHAEYFCIRSSGAAEDATRGYFSPGIHYLLTPDLEVGVRLGWGLNDSSARFFTNVGVGWRF
jgi:hypothetical protein